MKCRYLNIREAGEYLGFSVHTLYSWTSQRVIPFYKRGGRVRFDKAELDKWMQEGRYETVVDPGSHFSGERNRRS